MRAAMPRDIATSEKRNGYPAAQDDAEERKINLCQTLPFFSLQIRQPTGALEGERERSYEIIPVFAHLFPGITEMGQDSCMLTDALASQAFLLPGSLEMIFSLYPILLIYAGRARNRGARVLSLAHLPSKQINKKKPKVTTDSASAFSSRASFTNLSIKQIYFVFKHPLS